jgi:8-hydroxy-5-deazaflavin:NADPH oxidoreductase
VTSRHFATDQDSTVGIIGAGRAGSALARTALRAFRQVIIANSRGPRSLYSVVEALGGRVSAGTRNQAADCGIVMLAVPWTAVSSAVSGLSWDGKTVVDATNALLFPDLKPAPLDGRTSSELVAELVPDALLVKAGNTFSAEVLARNPVDHSGRRVMFVSGDHESAKQAVTDLFQTAGFYPIDLGGLVAGGRLQQFGGPLSGQNLVRREM